MPLPRDDRSDPDQLRQAKGYTDLQIQFLRELFDAAVKRLEERDDAKYQSAAALIASAEKAVLIAFEEQKSKWVVANEFRASLNDAAVRTMPRAEIEERFKTSDRDIDMLKSFMYAQQGSKTALVAALGILLGLIGAGLAIFNTIRAP